MSIINLLPQDYLLRRKQRRANTACLILFAVVMAGVMGAAAVSEQNTRRTLQVAQRVDADYAQATRLIQEMQQLDAEKRTLLQKAESISSIMERVPRSYLLATLTNALPENTSLIGVTLDSKQIVAAAKPPPAAASAGPPTEKSAALAAKRFSKPGQPTVFIDVTGLAETDVQVARFIANLARCPLTAGVDLVFSQEKTVDKRQVREFQVKVELKSNVDVMDTLAPRDQRLALAAGRQAGAAQ